jgi:hypothetical protein
MTPEQKASQNVRLQASRWGAKLFRNNSGVLKNPSGIPVRFGLGNESEKLNKKFKSSDYIGFMPIKITQEMVGKTVAVFMAPEVKAEGFKEQKEYFSDSREYAQKKFIDLIKKHGGLSGFVTNAKDVDRLIQTYLFGLKK